MYLNFNFVVDRHIRGRIYPAFAEWTASPYTPEWRQFEQHWPYTVPLRIQEYSDWHGAAIALHSVDSEFPIGSFYPIALGWFDFDLDYIDLIPDAVISAVVERGLKILFYYHEGDDPAKIKTRLDQCVAKKNLPTSCYKFVSANTAADKLENFVYFADFELWYWQRNRMQPAIDFNGQLRSKDFCALVRLHKDWRMAAMADLMQNRLLDNSYWSYCEIGQLNRSQCPIEVDSIPGLLHSIDVFAAGLPVTADNWTQDQRNDHGQIESKFFTDAYFHIVLETHFDADGSGGAFLTEKTFKPIKHGQPFFIAGPAGSLQALRNLGYKTFDSVLDNSYDTISDNTQRWMALVHSIKQAHQQGLHQLAVQCETECLHNQQLFVGSKQQRLSNLVSKLYE